MALKDQVKTYDDVRALKPCIDPVAFIAHDWTGTCGDILALLAPAPYRVWAVAMFFNDLNKYRFASELLAAMTPPEGAGDTASRVQAALAVYFTGGSNDFDALFLESAAILAGLSDDASDDLENYMTTAHFAISPLPEGAFYSAMQTSGLDDTTQLALVAAILAAHP